MKRYLIVFSQQFQTFRDAEFRSLCSFFGIKEWKFVDFVPENKDERRLDPETMCLVDLPSTSDLKNILSRSVLIRFGVEFWSQGSSYSELISNLKGKIDKYQEVFHFDQSYAMKVVAVGRSKSMSYSIKRINELNFLPFKGRVDLSTPLNLFYIVEDHVGSNRGGNRPKSTEELDPSDTMKGVYFGRFVGSGQMMFVSKYGLNKRKFIGNTSMDPVLSIIQANLALAGPSSLVIDPFVGTGSLLLAAAHFGAYCIGTEINYNVVHGLGRSSRANTKFRAPDEGVLANFEQYGLRDKYLDVLLADASRPDLWKWKSVFDAIVADPPYGLREKSAKLGYKKGVSNQNIPDQVQHYPEKTKYHFKDVLLDLLNFSAEYLRIGGRFTYWLPVINEDYTADTVPKHPCLKLLYNCEQRIARIYGRRLIAMEKLMEPEKTTDKAFLIENPYEEKTLRDKIFKVAITKERCSKEENGELCKEGKL